MTTKSTTAERAEWLENLREMLPPGSTVHTVMRHVSASGMSRAIDAYALEAGPDGSIVKHWLSYRIAAVLGWPFSDRYEAINVSGAGMDMGFHLVYALSYRLYPDGFDCIGDRCPSNDHSNYRHDGSPMPTHHVDGGYALRQNWI